ncbi:MAG: dienelactone hydrolase family protein [Rhodospirillaceae bacterium]|nr:dienelactone hydrolase family protein [Rhodospirillales bacterium]
MPEFDPIRRSLLTSLAGLPLAAILADPVLAQTAAQITRDQKITTAGGREVSAALAKPDTAQAHVPTIMLVHEWWGLNDQIKAVAVDLARQGYLALAVDLFQGRVATGTDEARSLSQMVKPEEAADTLSSWAGWLKNHPDGNRKAAVMGWCFGGGWALNAATIAPMDAAVVYYGRVNLPPEQLSRLKGPVLGHFGKSDQFINKDVVEGFERTMKQVGKPYTVHWYDAGHAFANPTGDNFRKDDAQLAWKRSLEFLRKELG